MKKSYLLLLAALIITGCSEKSNFLLPADQMECREIAYYSLTDQEKQTLTTDWKEAEVRHGYYSLKDNINWMVFDSGNKSGFTLMNPDALLVNNQPLVMVTFHTNADALLGPIALIVDPGSKKIVGGLLRM